MMHECYSLLKSLFFTFASINSDQLVLEQFSHHPNLTLYLGYPCMYAPHLHCVTCEPGQPRPETPGIKVARDNLTD
jgi:hypothetical protein